MNIYAFHFTKYLSGNLNNTEDDKKTWFNMKKFIYDY